MTSSTDITDVRRIVLIMFILITCLVLSGFCLDGVHPTNVNYTQWGDINLGGLFPLHLYAEEEQDCAALRGLDALKRVEAMAYTVRAINANDTLLPNITLGYEIYDTCSYSAQALKQSLKMIPVQRQRSDCAVNSSMTALPPIAGVVGAQRSASSLQAAILFSLYGIPQVSYLSTSDDLSNDDRYPYFLRTVPPDRFQVNAMVDILLTYDWKYVSFINSDDTYGKSAQSQFRSRAADNDICLAVVRTIPASVDTYDEVIDDLLDTQTESTHSTVVILFVQLETARNIFSAAAAKGAYRRFIWIGSDGWGNYGLEPVLGNEEVALGAFTVVPLSGQLTAYNEYLRTITTSNSSNPWLGNFMETYGNCETSTVINGTEVCDSWTLEGVPEVDEPAHETIVMDSVLAFAYGLNTMQMTMCADPSKGLCDEMRNADGTTLRDFLLETEFDSPVNGHVKFLENGDMGGRYGIRNLQQLENGDYAFLDVGSWVDSETSDRLMIEMEIPWYLTGNSTLWNEETGVPQSVCSQPCGVGEKRTVLPENPCCWSCTLCHASEIVVNNGTTCQTCIVPERNSYQWPNDARSSCEVLEPTVNKAWMVSLVILAGIGLVATIITFSIYVHNREKPLVKASSKELSYIIFAGLFLAFFTAMLYGVTPSPGICTIRRMGSPIALSLIYVSIATKTIRLYRIFRAGLKSASRPKYISPSSQVVLSLTVCLIPVVWVATWLIIIPPAVVITMPDPSQPRIELTCDESDIELIGAISWEICLIIICCIFAFVTRKLPENYNESRFITFCVFSSLVVFLSFAPAIFTTKEAIYKASYSALGLIINGTVTLMCLFFVKLYALYFVDERELNVFTQSRTRSNTRTNSIVNVPTSEGSNPTPSSAGPHDNKGYNGESSNNREQGGNSHNSNNNNNNNNRLTLPPIIRNAQANPGNGPVDPESGLARSKSSGKNSGDGSGSGRGSNSGRLMNRLRGNSVHVGDTGESGADDEGKRGNGTDGVRTVSNKEMFSSKEHYGRQASQSMCYSEDSSSSQSDDQHVLVKVNRTNRHDHDRDVLS